MAGITVVGSINMDLVAGVARLPREGETLTGKSLASFPGGKGANQAVCAARLGGTVQMVGRLGDDAFGQQLLSELERAGVGTQAIRKVQGPSGSAVVLVSDTGANSIIVIPGANAEMTPDALDLHLEELQQSSMLLTQMETPPETAERLASIAQQFNIPLILDPAPAHGMKTPMLREVSWLTPNESETCTLLGMPPEQGWSEAELHQIAHRVLELGPRNVVLKLGERGVLLMGKDTPTYRSAGFPVRAVDTTAAGDSFNGAFACALTSHALPAPAAAQFACAAAAIAVTRVGAQPAMPTLDEVEALLRQGSERPRMPWRYLVLHGHSRE